MSTILAVVAHSDDETLGCGATLFEHAKRGDSVHAVAFTDGVGARAADPQEAAQRLKAANAAAQTLGFKWWGQGTFPDNQLDTVARLELIQFLEKAITELQPSIIYTHAPSDLNIDHRIVFESVLVATRPMEGRSVQQVSCFEVPSSTEWSFGKVSGLFTPDHFVDVTNSFGKKIEALRHYSAEMRKFPHPRSLEAIEHLAGIRGSQVGFTRAEAFQTVRKLGL